jgi:hypothetical protein
MNDFRSFEKSDLENLNMKPRNINNDSESNLSDFYIGSLFEDTNNKLATQDQVKENIKQIFNTLAEQFKEELRISELKQKPTKLGK